MRKALIAIVSGAALSAGVLTGAAPAQANPAPLAPFFWIGAASGATVGVAATAGARQPPPDVVETPVGPPVAYAGPPPAADQYGPLASDDGQPVYAPIDRSGSCAIVTQPTPTGWRSVEVCD